MIKAKVTQQETEVFDIVEVDSTVSIDNILQTDTLPAEFFQFFEIEESDEKQEISVQ